MKSISKDTIICLSIALASQLISCSTTGDPTKGGIFWSPSKAMERRQALLSEQRIKQSTLKNIQKKTSSYSSERASLLKKRDELKARKASASFLQDEAAINAAIKDIEAELEKM